MANPPRSPADLNLPPTEPIDISWAAATAHSVDHPEVPVSALQLRQTQARVAGRRWEEERGWAW